MKKILLASLPFLFISSLAWAQENCPTTNAINNQVSKKHKTWVSPKRVRWVLQNPQKNLQPVQYLTRENSSNRNGKINATCTYVAPNTPSGKAVWIGASI